MTDPIATRQPAPVQSVRIMTYNIHRWAGEDRRADLDRLAEIIRAARADVVGLNEVIHPVTRHGRSHDYLGELAARLGMFSVFGPSGWLDYGPDWHGPQGNALLSRYPLAETRNLLLPRPPATKQRALLGARLTTGPAAGLMAFITHLDHAFEGARLLQIQGALAEALHHGPHFIAGDFNTPGFGGRYGRRFSTPVLRQMCKAGYEDAFQMMGVGSGRTFPARSPIFRVDFLFFPKAWAQGVRRAHALDEERVPRASDHRPVVAEWAWPV